MKRLGSSGCFTSRVSGVLRRFEVDTEGVEAVRLLGAGSSLLNELKSIAGVGVLIDDEDAALEVKPHCGSTSGALLSRKLVGKGDVRRPFAFVLTMGQAEILAVLCVSEEPGHQSFNPLKGSSPVSSIDRSNPPSMAAIHLADTSSLMLGLRRRPGRAVTA